ncbi:MAG: endonuclease domain-containing protein [Clostridia bacterium]|nr:endonuclease domain-containing protein [Clostridia bacterium]
MERKHNPKLTETARLLRKNMTDEERRMWYEFLRTYPIPFARQKVLGKYIVDFYCAKAKLVVELDGSQHYEEKMIEKDRERTAYLEQYGLTVLRIPNNEIHSNFYGACEYIDHFVKHALSRLR